MSVNQRVLNSQSGAPCPGRNRGGTCLSACRGRCCHARPVASGSTEYKARPFTLRLTEVEMPTYRASILDQWGRTLLRTSFDAFSEPEALERARSLAHGRAVEIEKLGHKVARIPSTQDKEE